MPPLRTWAEDIPLLANHLLKKISEEIGKNVKGFTAEAMDVLTHHNWPGNIRELDNEVRRAAMLVLDNEMITPDLFSIGHKIQKDDSRNSTDIKDRVKSLEIQLITDALGKHKGNITHAAEYLKLTRRGLQKKLDQYHLRALISELKGDGGVT